MCRFKSIAICLSIKKGGNTFVFSFILSRMSYLKWKSCSLIRTTTTLHATGFPYENFPIAMSV